MKSHVYIKKGLKFIFLTGETPYEVGLNHGKLLKEEIKLTIKGIKDFTYESGGPLLNGLSEKGIFLGVTFLKKKFSTNFLREMEGIADGSGQDLSWIIFANSIYDIGASFSGLLKFDACSCFVSASKNGETFFGKTTDLSVPPALVKTFVEQRIIFVYDLPFLKTKFVTTSWPMCLTGDVVFLENGLTIAFNDGGTTYNKKPNFNFDLILTIIRSLSEKCKSSQQVVENLNTFKTVKPFICTVTDGKSSGSFIIEINQENFSKRDFENYLITANHFLSKEMQEKSYKKNFESDHKYQGSLKRYENMENLIKKGINNFSDAINVLKIHEATFDIDMGSVSNLATVQGEIFDPSKKKISFSSGNNTPITLFGEWQEFSLREIFEHGLNFWERLKKYLVEFFNKIW